MMRVFKRGVNLGEFFAREDAKPAFLCRLTEVMQDGLYRGEVDRAKPKGEQLEERKLFLPGQRARALTERDWTRDVVERISAMQARGEVFTADQLSGLFPKPPAEVYRDDNPIDDQWMSIFRVVESTGASELYTKTGVTVEFKEIAEGEAPELQRFSGSTVTLVNKEYGALVGYSRNWVADGRANMIEEATQDVREAWGDLRATYFYGLISSASFTATAYATDWGTTLNGAFARLIRAKRLGPNQRPVVAAPVEKAGVILQAVKDTLIAERGVKLTMIPDLVFTRYYLDSGSALYVCAPKKHFIDQEREALHARQDDGGALNIEKIGYYGRYRGLVREATAGEKITY